MMPLTIGFATASPKIFNVIRPQPEAFFKIHLRMPEFLVKARFAFANIFEAIFSRKLSKIFTTSLTILSSTASDNLSVRRLSTGLLCLFITSMIPQF